MPVAAGAGGLLLIVVAIIIICCLLKSRRRNHNSRSVSNKNRNSFVELNVPKTFFLSSYCAFKQTLGYWYQSVQLSVCLSNLKCRKLLFNVLLDAMYDHYIQTSIQILSSFIFNLPWNIYIAIHFWHFVYKFIYISFLFFRNGCLGILFVSL